MKINIGCGEFPAAGWLNLDATHESADLLWDCSTGLLPSPGRPISRIYAGHVLEHLPYPDLVGILRAWRNNPGVHEATQLAVVGPDCDVALLLHAQGELDDETLQGCLSGGCRWPGDSHLWHSNRALTATVLQMAGWATEPVEDVQLAVEDWPVTALVDWQFALLAHPA